MVDILSLLLFCLNFSSRSWLKLVFISFWVVRRNIFTFTLISVLLKYIPKGSNLLVIKQLTYSPLCQDFKKSELTWLHSHWWIPETHCEYIPMMPIMNMKSKMKINLGTEFDSWGRCLIMKLPCYAPFINSCIAIPLRRREFIALFHLFYTK